MKKVLTSLVFMAVFGLYALYQYFGSANTVTIQNVAPPVTAPVVTNTLPPVVKPKSSGQYADGTYTGPSVDAYYGNVQVEAIVSGGRLADVKFLDYPSDRSTSRYISGQATPILRSEAISAQSANVNVVSGATDTSRAFVESLSGALSSARN